MATQTEIEDWASSDFLLVKDVQVNDILEVTDVVGIVESFGKKKLQLTVLLNGRPKILNINKVQHKQMEPITRGGKYQVSKISINGGTALNFKRLI